MQKIPNIRYYRLPWSLTNKVCEIITCNKRCKINILILIEFISTCTCIHVLSTMITDRTCNRKKRFLK